MNQSPRVLGNRYEVGDLLGRGGMAEVHLGRDTRLGRVVAIKLLRTDLARDPMFQARFRREAQSAAGLNHPAIVAVYDTGEETITESGGSTVALPYIVMEYVEGRTLREMLRDGKPLEVSQALEITGGVLSALDYSHRMGIVHRDIKPANVMLTAAGDIKVMDFGIARALADVSATMTQTQAVIGTAQYLSPEQARGETVDARSDLYSAGCLLYELMTGRPPFVADSPVAVAYQHVREQPHPPSAFNPVIPEVVDRVVLHALAKDREARYQTANEFKADLDAARTGRAVSAGAMAMAPSSQPTTQQLSGPQAPQAPQTATEYLTPKIAGTHAYPSVGQTMPGAPVPPPMYEPAVDQSYNRRSRERQPGGGDGRKVGFALLAIAVLVLFAGAAYMVSSLVRSNNAANAQVVIPDVEGDTQKVATDKLTAAGFQFTITSQTSNTPKNSAIKTDPLGGTAHRKGSLVTLYISSGPASGTVPDLKGKSQADAVALLTAQGFVQGLVSSEDAPGLAKGSVSRTDPAAGQTAQRGSKIALYLSNGKIHVPDVTGKTQAEATAALTKAGITNITVELVQSDQTPGMVIEQDPKDVVLDAPRTVKLFVVQPAQQSQSSTTDNGGGNNNGGGQPTDTVQPGTATP
ncbi:MAG TPA: Stk1 family PASTA domain-containing Ser/Thr kinase [Kineosporiaceae bacterium]|nr:Stk1 family PASTA domain-containing Ser/Thr kinase [Kineosporiaceae bacterium]